MIKTGTIALMHFPHEDYSFTKLRPILIVCKAPSTFDDWLVCLVSTQTQHYIDGVDELLDNDVPDYQKSGVKTKSIIRIGQLLTTDKKNFVGEIGSISKARLKRIQANISKYVLRNEN